MPGKMSRLALPGRPPSSYIGPQEDEIGVRVACRRILSEAWERAHPDGSSEDPPTDDDWMVQVVLLGSYAYHSRLKHPGNWDRGEFPVAELALVPLKQWKFAADGDIARKKGDEPPEWPTEVQAAPADDATTPSPETPEEPPASA